ncbi:hypothetical protein HanIR_Chr12g0584331 [Helianthus annuus]|nr:hypothetical protein HanIR_Chr12g0584331 [Helianthus annuus]
MSTPQVDFCFSFLFSVSFPLLFIVLRENGVELGVFTDKSYRIGGVFGEASPNRGEGGKERDGCV